MIIISFGSTFRIPISQPGVNSAKKERLKQFIASYENGLIGNSKTGYARVSILDSEDAEFVRRLKQVGYKIFQKFDGENIPKNEIDSFIKTRLNAGDFSQTGKNKKPLSKQQRLKKRYEDSFDVFKKNDNNVNTDLALIEIDTAPVDKHRVASKIAGVADSAENKYNRIRASENYLKIKEEYGVEFAEAVFFDKR